MFTPNNQPLAIHIPILLLYMFCVFAFNPLPGKETDLAAIVTRVGPTLQREEEDRLANLYVFIAMIKNNKCYT